MPRSTASTRTVVSNQPYKLSKNSFTSRLISVKHDIKPRKILLYTFEDSNEETQLEENLYLRKEIYGENQIECVYTNSESGIKRIDSVEIPEFFFAIFTPDDLINIIQNKFVNNPCVRDSFVSENGLLELKDLFREYKERCKELLLQLDEAVAPDDFEFVPVLKESYYNNTFLTVYCGKELSDENNLLIYQNNNPGFFESRDATVLVTIKKDNFYKMESIVAKLENGNIQFKKNIIDLPEQFYINKLSDIKTFVNEHKTELPFVFDYNLTGSKEMQWILGQFRKIHLYDNDAYSVCVIPAADNFSCEIELERKNDNTTEVIRLKKYYYAIFEQENLTEKIIELLNLTDDRHKANVKVAVKQNQKLGELFSEARKSFVCNPETGKVNQHAVKLVEKLKHINAFYDVYGGVIGGSYYDGISGVPTSCNYIKMNEDIPVNNAVLQYLTLKDADVASVFDWRSDKDNWYAYSERLREVLRPWRYDSTYILVNETNMMLPKDELESVYRLCKENSIYLVKNVKGNYYDYINDYYFEIVEHEYPGSADDTATYCEYEFKTVELLNSYALLAKKEAIQNLRQMVLDKINNQDYLCILLETLLYEKANECFPGGPNNGWDFACFIFDLEDKKLYANVSKYPNAFGAAPESRIYLSAEDFAKIADEFDFSDDLKYMKNQEDWESVINTDVEKAINVWKKKKEEKTRIEKEKMRMSHGIVIPDSFAEMTPKMNYGKVSILLLQRHGSSRLELLLADGKYHIEYKDYAMNSNVPSLNYNETLSQAEASWAEEQVTNKINNKDSKVWSSNFGNDSMEITIIKNGETVVKQSGAALVKYYNLMEDLRALAMYGSLFESEKQ